MGVLIRNHLPRHHCFLTTITDSWKGLWDCIQQTYNCFLIWQWGTPEDGSSTLNFTSLWRASMRQASRASMLHTSRNPKMPAVGLGLSFPHQHVQPWHQISPLLLQALHSVELGERNLEVGKNACRIHFLSKEREVFELFQHQQPYIPSTACSPSCEAEETHKGCRSALIFFKCYCSSLVSNSISWRMNKVFFLLFHCCC